MTAEIATMARDFSLWLNSTYPPNLDTEALHWRRVRKVSEEAGEVEEALAAWVHENPRKPAGPVEDVIKELADCVGAALGAIEHLTGHNGLSLEIATERVGVREAPASVHRPFADDGVTYCGWDGKDGCGEAWPCATVRNERGEG